MERLTLEAMEDNDTPRAQQKKAKKVKVVQEKSIENNVFIPSTISVGQLAKLLRVKRGMCISLGDAIWPSF